MEVFRNIPKESPVIVAEGVWQYSQFILGGLMVHKGPILTIANWDGKWPGLVGLLNLNASLTKAGVRYSSLWSETFGDSFFEKGLQEWLSTGYIKYDQSHVKDFDFVKIPLEEEQIGRSFANEFRTQQAILGVFDEGCMGMYNAIVPDDVLNKLGLYKERLSQSMLYAKMRTVGDQEAEAILDWLIDRGMRFEWGTDRTRPNVPEGIRHARITYTERGLKGPRFWLRTTPDGSLVVFLMEDEYETVQLFGVSPNGGSVNQLTFNSFSVQGAFNVSPDGKYIAYPADNSLFVVEIMSGKSRRITRRFSFQDRPIGAPVWSNSGNSIAYNRYVRYEESYFLQIFLLKRDVCRSFWPIGLFLC